MAVLAAIPGLVDWTDIRADHPAKKPATTHLWLNGALIVVAALNLVLRLIALDEIPTPLIPVLLSVLGVGILSVSGYLGGKIVYDDGIGVGRHRRKAPTPDATLRPTEKNGAKPGQYVEVGAADKLAEGETLRLDLLGHVIAVAKVGGEVYAFQEFCTHRFGPLSEGSFEDHEVRCPWHGSCFDVRTGKVTQGPAKLDLNTYEVRVREGKIEVCAPDKRAG
jgi:nitrite reductase/ring-hydroxylating ferredoxin subunit